MMTGTQSTLPVADKAKQALSKNGNGNKPAANGNGSPKNLIGLKSEKIKDLFSVYRSQIAMVLPKIMTPDRLINVATSMVVRTPELASCTTGSIIGAMLQAATLGLDPTPALSYVYFIPRNNKKTSQKEVQFMISYRGLLALLRRTGQVETAYSYVVYEKDHFNFKLGLHPDIDHIPCLERERGSLTHVYAVIKFKDGGMIFEVMSKADVYKVRESSESKNTDYSPWKKHEAEMWRKTVLRRLCKFAPVSIEDSTGMQFEQQISADEGIIDADKIDPITKEIPVEHDYDVEEADIVDEIPNDTEEKKEKTPEQIKAEKLHNDFLEKARVKYDQVAGDEGKLNAFNSELGDLGYASLDEVEPDNYGKVLNVLQSILKSNGN